MPKFAANLTMLFTDVPFMERFRLARQAGFRFVEYLFPYDFEVDALGAELQANGLKQVLFNLPAGNWAAGERGIAANPQRIEDFRGGVLQAVKYAQGLGITRVNCLVGKKVAGHDDRKQWWTLVENVRFAAQVLQDNKITLVVEAINHFDVPGFLLNRTEEVVRLIGEVGMPNVLIQYDVYHAQREEGEIVATLRKHAPLIGHIQVADNPGRHQPGTGEINYTFVFKEIDALAYSGYIGLEYVPEPGAFSPFEWITRLGYSL